MSDKFPDTMTIFEDSMGDLQLVEKDDQEGAVEYIRSDLLVQLKEAANEAIKKPFEIQAIMRREGIKIDNLDDPMQKFAFSVYSELAQVALSLEQAIASLEEGK
jgi:hypothetical protein